jgi:fatty acid desaturase
MPGSKTIEWPTLGLALMIYVGWSALLFYHSVLPSVAVVCIGAWLIAWQSSLQHEILHGHPTPWSPVNSALAFAPLSLWLPYDLYRTSHLAHHRSHVLADPFEDPESYYWTASAWDKLGPLGRWLVRSQSTFVGRLMLGPAWNFGKLVVQEGRRAKTDPLDSLKTWGPHFIACAVLLVWIIGICKMNLWFYLFGIVYPGISLSLIRSFAEHRASDSEAERTAIVENSKVLGLLFLFNNLHIVHHRRPDLPWYKIPSWYRTHRDVLIAADGTRRYNGYGEIMRRFLFSPFDEPVRSAIL